MIALGDRVCAALGADGVAVCLDAATDGNELGSLDLGRIPVYDGMAAAAARLVVSTEDGKLQSFGKP